MQGATRKNLIGVIFLTLIVAVLSLALFRSSRVNQSIEQTHGSTSSTMDTANSMGAATAEGRSSAVSLDHDSTGEIALYYAASGRPASDIRWRIWRADRELDLPVNGDGIISNVPPGVWHLATFDHEVLVGVDSCMITANTRTRVWCWRIKDFLLRVLDETGNPIAAAEVEWRSPVSHYKQYPEVLVGTVDSARSVSDDDGVATLDDIPDIPGAIVAVRAAGFISAMLTPDYSAIKPLTVVLQTALSSGLRIRVVDLNDGPFARTTVSTAERTLGITDDKGILLIDSTIMPTQDLYFQGDCFPSSVRLSDIIASNGDVVLPRSVRGTLTVIPERALAGSLCIRATGDDDTFESVRFEESVSVLIDRMGKCALNVPARVTIRLSLFDDSGSHGHTTLLAHDNDWEATIVLAAGDQLNIRPTVGEEPLASCEATIAGLIPDNRHVVEMAADGLLHIPNPGQVSRIGLRATGAAPTDLTPYGQGFRGGTLNLPLEPVIETEVLVRTFDARLLHAAELYVYPEDTAFARFPDRNGMWPTDHPAWSRTRISVQVLPIDADGRVVASLAEGVYRLSVRPVPWRRTLLDPYLYETVVHVTRDQTLPIEILIPGFVEVTLTVISADTGRPVPRFELRGPITGLIDEVEGPVWSGFVDFGTSRIDIITPRGEHGTMAIDTESAQISATVYVSDEGAAKLRFSYADGRPFTGTVFGNVMAYRSDLGGHHVGGVDIDVADNGNAQLFLPHDYGVTVILSGRTREGRKVRMTPERITWNGSGETNIVVAEKQ